MILTATLPGVVRPTSRLILYASKPNRASLALTPSNVSTIRAIIKQTFIPVHSGAIGLTKSGMQRNIKNSGSPGSSWFSQLWAVVINDYQRHQDFLTECVEEQSHHQHNPGDSVWVQHSVYSRTFLVYHLFHSKL